MTERWLQREEREEVCLAGSVVLPDGQAVPVMIADVTRAGCRIRCSPALPIGGRVVLQVGGRNLDMTVRWSFGSAAGLQVAPLVSKVEHNRDLP